MPAETLEGFQHWLVETSDCADVNTYLARFELPLQLMQDAPSIARVTKDLMTELSRQGHIYDEIRFAPQLHRREGLTQRQAIEAVLEGRRQALAENPGYDAGILLCAMCIGPETVNMAENLETVRLAKEFLGRGVVGADLAGAEGIVPLQSFHPVFDLARELGIPATCHAGDSQGPDTVRDALSFGVRRIGHGHHIYDEPSLWEPAIARGVTLEICPTSNIQCHTQPSLPGASGEKAFGCGTAPLHQHGQYDPCRRESGRRVPPLCGRHGLDAGGSREDARVRRGGSVPAGREKAEACCARQRSAVIKTKASGASRMLFAAYRLSMVF